MSLFLTGQRLTADLLNAQLEPPIVQLVQPSAGAQTGWTSATPTAITFASGSTVKDTDSLHSESSNTSRIVIGGKLGIWEISGVYVPPTNAATTLCRAIVYKNGSYIAGSFAGLPFSSTTALIGIPSGVIEVEATVSTDYVELMGYQTAGSGTIGTSINTYAASSLRARWVRPS